MGFLAAIAPFIALAGSGISAIGAIGQAKTQSEIMKANATMAERKGEAARLQEKAKSRQLSDERRKLVGAQTAAYGGAGVDMVGSPLDVIANSYSAYERDIQTTGYSADVARRAGQGEADIYRWGAGRAMTAGYMSAGTSLLGGVAKFGKGFGIDGGGGDGFIYAGGGS